MSEVSDATGGSDAETMRGEGLLKVVIRKLNKSD